jgi:hypothetical protein
VIIVHGYEPPSATTWYFVINGMRNSWESWERGDSEYDEPGNDWTLPAFYLGDADKNLAQRLTKTGADHGKYLRQLPVVIDITAPAYFWREFDTYHIGVTSNSTSQMHTLGKHPFNASMFCFEDVDITPQTQILETLNWLRDRWIDEGGKRKGPDATYWRAMVQAIPDSWMYRRCVSLNYQVLRNMYFVRRNHRLTEWRQWCAWVDSLPYSELITVE